MITINQLFSLILSCVMFGTPSNIDSYCILPLMEEIPYISVPQDSGLPSFDTAKWYSFPFNNALRTNYELLFKDDKILQSGITIHFYADKKDTFKDVFNALYSLAKNEFGEPEFSHTARIPEYQIVDLRTYNFKYKGELFYIRTSTAMGIPNIVFRAGNSEYYR